MWIDEGAADVRGEAAGAVERATSSASATATAAATPMSWPSSPPKRRDRRRGERLAQRLAEAEGALERDRLDEARRIVTPLLREVPGVAAVHEVAGLVNYRLGRWRDAVRELEAAQALAPRRRPAARARRQLPRAQALVATSIASGRRFARSHPLRTCSPRRASSPPAPRPIAATSPARCERWRRSRQRPKRVRDHHLRQWYVLGDLHDRAGDPLEATRWFERVAGRRSRLRRRPRLACARSAAEARAAQLVACPPVGSRHFRAGVVAVIERGDGAVLAFERADAPGSWQLPQGGIEPGEEADRRGVARAQGGDRSRPGRRELVGEHPEWVAYEWPAEVRAGRQAASARCSGGSRSGSSTTTSNRGPTAASSGLAVGRAAAG